MSRTRIVAIAGSLSQPSRARRLVEDVAGRIQARSAGAVMMVDLIVAGPPIYQGSYTGFFKHLIDPVDDKALQVKVRLRASDELREIEADVAALATGPAHGGVAATDPLVSRAVADGYLRPDALGLGLAVDQTSRALGSTDTLFVAGPLARGAFGELMGLPEVARHAERVAGAVLRFTFCDERV